MRLNKAVILIKKAALEFDREANIVLGEYDLTASQYKVMKFIFAEEENGVRITDLEKYYSMSHPTTIGIVRNLERKGLIAYEDNPSDARSRFIVPTDKAQRQRLELDGLGEKLETQMTSRLSPDEHRELVRLLRKMLDIGT